MKKCKLFFHTIIILSFLIIIGGCQSKRSSFDIPYLKITDDLKREVVLRKKPTRIISLAPSITEILFALDGGQSLIGVTEYCDYPVLAREKVSVGGMINPNYEIIAELKPDLILMTVEGNNQNDFIKLEKLGYNIFVINSKELEGIFISILSLGRIIGKENSAADLITNLREKEFDILQKAKLLSKKNIFVIISLQPLIGAGPSTFINEMISMVGAVNIAGTAKTSYPIINREEILKQDPDIVIVMDDVVKNYNEILKQYPEWKNLKAFNKNKIQIVNADILSRPGPRIIDGMEILVNSLK